jgi:hypothetical protein
MTPRRFLPPWTEHPEFAIRAGTNAAKTLRLMRRGSGSRAGDPPRVDPAPHFPGAGAFTPVGTVQKLCSSA